MKKKITIPPIERQRETLNLYKGDAYYVERRAHEPRRPTHRP